MPRSVYGPRLTSSRRPSVLVLDRFALLDDVKALGETWFLARVFALLRSAGIEAVATFSDPLPGRDRHGRSIHVGHIGTVFQAASAIHTGLTARETSTNYTTAVSWSTAERLASSATASAPVGTSRRFCWVSALRLGKLEVLSEKRRGRCWSPTSTWTARIHGTTTG